YRFSPFMASDEHNDFGTLNEQIKRARLFCDTYGLKQDERTGLTNTIINRLEVLLYFMTKSADQGKSKYINAIEEGHHKKYINDIEYIKINKHIINENLMEELK
ncbi:MAG: hypothetical protein ACRYE9_01770, partial [Janthinobacterium lividum]